MSRRAHTLDRVPLCAAGLHLVIEPVEHGRLAPAVTLLVYANSKATNVGATFPAGEAEGLAAAIVAAAKRACEAQLFAPAKIPAGGDAA